MPAARAAAATATFTCCGTSRCSSTAPAPATSAAAAAGDSLGKAVLAPGTTRLVAPPSGSSMTCGRGRMAEGGGRGTIGGATTWLSF